MSQTFFSFSSFRLGVRLQNREKRWGKAVHTGEKHPQILFTFFLFSFFTNTKTESRRLFHYLEIENERKTLEISPSFSMLNFHFHTRQKFAFHDTHKFKAGSTKTLAEGLVAIMRCAHRATWDETIERKIAMQTFTVDDGFFILWFSNGDFSLVPTWICSSGHASRFPYSRHWKCAWKTYTNALFPGQWSFPFFPGTQGFVRVKAHPHFTAAHVFIDFRSSKAHHTPALIERNLFHRSESKEKITRFAFSNPMNLSKEISFLWPSRKIDRSKGEAASTKKKRLREKREKHSAREKNKKNTTREAGKKSSTNKQAASQFNWSINTAKKKKS